MSIEKEAGLAAGAMSAAKGLLGATTNLGKNTKGLYKGVSNVVGKNAGNGMRFGRLFKMKQVEEDRLSLEEEVRRRREYEKFNPYEFERNPYTLLVREQELKLDISELRAEIDSLERSMLGREDERSINVANRKGELIRGQLGRKLKELYQVQKKFNELSERY